MAMLTRRKGLTLATDYVLALRSRSFSQLGLPSSHRLVVEAGLAPRVGLPNSPLGFGVASLFGIGSRRGISGVAKWVGQGEMQTQCQPPQGLALLGRRNFNLSSLRDRLKGATGKVKETVVPKGSGAPPPAELSVWKPVNTAKRTVMGYREALGLQLEAFWKRNYLVVVGFLGFGVCLLLWRLMFGIASTFVSLSEGMAKFGFLALAAAIVTVGVSYLSFFSSSRFSTRNAIKIVSISAGILSLVPF